jgi:threonine dehydrogenase-like Zn-dependent dehydrogenase
MMYGSHDVRVEDRADPVLLADTDAIIKVAASCVCGCDLWPYRGTDPISAPTPMGHEYLGVVQQIGGQVKKIKVGDFVVGSFLASDNTCEICNAGYQSRCVRAELMGSIGTQAEMARIPLADGTLVGTPGRPDDDLIPSLLAASGVLGTGWFAVGLLGVLAAQQLGAEPIIAISRQPDRQALAREFGATDIVEEHGDEGVVAVKELTGGWGPQRHRSGRHPGINDAGHPLHPPRRPRRIRRRRPRRATAGR